MAPKWEAVERRHDVSCKSERRRSLPRFFNVNLRARSELRKQLRAPLERARLAGRRASHSYTDTGFHAELWDRQSLLHSV